MVVAEAGGSAILWTVNVNTGAPSATVTVYDGEDANGNIVAIIDATTKSSHAYMRKCNAGIYVVLAGGNADVTVGYQ